MTHLSGAQSEAPYPPFEILGASAKRCAAEIMIVVKIIRKCIIDGGGQDVEWAKFHALSAGGEVGKCTDTLPCEKRKNRTLFSRAPFEVFAVLSSAVERVPKTSTFCYL